MLLFLDNLDSVEVCEDEDDDEIGVRGPRGHPGKAIIPSPEGT